MKSQEEKMHRRSLRLKSYDYSQPSAYFITVCSQNRKALFGDIVNQQIQLNNAGEMITKWLLELKNKFPGIQLDESVVMPNHFHGIVIILPQNPVGAALCGRPDEEGTHTGVPLRDRRDKKAAPTVGDIMDWFKSMTTNEYIRGVKLKGWHPFDGRLWQRNYYEHIVRNEESLNKIREYIIYNPLNWAIDRENPNRIGEDPFDRWLAGFQNHPGKS